MYTVLPIITIIIADLKKKAVDCAPQGGISYREETVSSAADWSQVQQKALEAALSSVPKSAADRWNEISQLVPGKDKVSVIHVIQPVYSPVIYLTSYIGTYSMLLI